MTETSIPLRPPHTVMRLSRMGSFHQSRLSFMRILLRRLKAENWRFEKHRFDIDDAGVGHAVYTLHGPARAYSLVAFAHDLPDEDRSDRVIAQAWDATFTLFDGIPTAADIARLSQNVPLQEAGRITETELTLSRANRSARMWDHTLERLAAGRQPDADLVRQVGYLMRTTAVYGSGKFGAADRDTIADRPECLTPFQVEMMSVWLIRAFVLDLVEHMAKVKAPATATTLAPDLRRAFGMGNSTGLGMAPFLLNHPVLLNSWMLVRETALARVRSLHHASEGEAQQLRKMLARAILNAQNWHSDHPLQQAKLTTLRADLSGLNAHLEAVDLSLPSPWNTLWLWAETALGEDAQEQLLSLLLEPYGHLVDGLADCMSINEAPHMRIDGTMSARQLRSLIEAHYDWALAINWAEKTTTARVWYVSEEKLEPRLGERAQEDLDAYEQPLCPAHAVVALYSALEGQDALVADLLLNHPEHRHAARRVQLLTRFPYAEVHDNTIDAQMLPIDLLRAKLSFFGAGHFDPRSDRWVRINMFQFAPFPQELADVAADDWTLPPLQIAAQ